MEKLSLRASFSPPSVLSSIPCKDQRRVHTSGGKGIDPPWAPVFHLHNEVVLGMICRCLSDTISTEQVEIRWERGHRWTDRAVSRHQALETFKDAL